MGLLPPQSPLLWIRLDHQISPTVPASLAARDTSPGAVDGLASSTAVNGAASSRAMCEILTLTLAGPLAVATYLGSVGVAGSLAINDFLDHW